MEFFEIFRIMKIIFILGNVAIANGADLRCYKGSFDNYTEYPLDNASPFLKSSYYYPEKYTVFYVFGFAAKPTAISVRRMVEAYLGQVNICVLNWEKEAAAGIMSPIDYTRAIRNAEKIGRELGNTLVDLFEAGLRPSNFHLIGHSLGGQLCGYTGRQVIENGYILERITGLDPAGPLYEGILSLRALSASDAKFVDMIHTNPGAFGTDENKGSVNIWLNCENKVQPGCEDSDLMSLTKQNLCSHFRAWEVFAEAIERPTAFEAIAATSCDDWREGRGGNETVYIGDEINTKARGVFYMRTSSTSPYGLGAEGTESEPTETTTNSTGLFGII